MIVHDDATAGRALDNPRPGRWPLCDSWTFVQPLSRTWATTPAWSEGQNGGLAWKGVSPINSASSPSDRAEARVRIRSILVRSVEIGLVRDPGASGGVFDSWQHELPGPSSSSSQASRNLPGDVS